MRTNKNFTYEVINNYADAAGKIDISYFAHCVVIVADNNRATCEEKYNTRRKARAVGISWLMYFIDSELKFQDHPGFYATNKQVMQWDRENGGQLEKVLDIVEKYIIDERNENN